MSLNSRKTSFAKLHWKGASPLLLYLSLSCKDTVSEVVSNGKAPSQLSHLEVAQKLRAAEYNRAMNESINIESPAECISQW